MINNNKYFNSGPRGERDFEDAGAQGLDKGQDAIRTAIAKREAAIKGTSANRFALRDKMVAEFKATHKRSPNRSELNNILSIINRQVGL